MTRPPAQPAAPGLARRVLTEEALGGRVLAWAGGVALFAALATLVWLGIDRGWIGEGLRCAVAAGASAALLAGGLRLGRRTTPLPEVAQALAGAGLAGLYLSTAVATAGYEVLPVAVGVPALFLVAGVAVVLALRREAPALAGLGLLAACSVPVLGEIGGRPLDGLGVAALLLVLVCALALVRRRAWGWLAPAATLLALPQGLVLAAEHQPDPGAVLGIDVRVLWLAAWTVAFGAVAAALALAWARRAADRVVGLSALGLLGFDVLTALGTLAAVQMDERLVAAAGAAALGLGLLVHLAVVRRRTSPATGAGLVELTVGVLGAACFDVALLVALHPSLEAVVVLLVATVPPLVVAARTRSAWTTGVLRWGAASQLALAAALCPQIGEPDAMASVVGVAAVVLAAILAARAAGDPRWRVGFDAAAIGVAAVWSAAALPDAAIVASWAVVGVALAVRARATGDPAALAAAPVLVLLAAGRSLLGLDGVPLEHLLSGLPAADAASALLVLLAAAAVVAAAVVLPAARLLPPAGRAAAAGVVAFAAGTLGVATAARVAGGSPDAVAVAVDVAWGAGGVVAIALGLARETAALRAVGLVVLATCAFKVALVDLAAVDVLWRVGAWSGLAVALLGGAALYARGEARRTARPGRAERT